MIINDLDLGVHPTWLLPYATNKGPEYSQNISTVLIDGLKETAFARGRQVVSRTETLYITASSPIGGAAAGSQQASQFLLNQLMELVGNRDLQPCFIQWASGGGIITADPQDGWYLIQRLAPDNEFVWSGIVKVDITVLKVAPPPPSKIGHSFLGGALQNLSYSGTPVNFVAFPFGTATVNLGAVRSTTSGDVPLVINPTVNPIPEFPSATIANWWRGGCQVFDVMSDLSGSGNLPGGGNLVGNPGLESQSGGAAQGWLSTGIGSGTAVTNDTSSPRTGSFNAKLTNPSNGNYGGVFTGAGTTSGVLNGISVAGINLITISIWAKASVAGTTGPFRVTFANFATTSNQPSAGAGIAVSDTTISVTTSYTQFKFNITVPVGYQYMYLEFYSNDNGTATPVFLDDIGLTFWAHPNWVEVKGTDHKFTGDVAVTNGLILLTVPTVEGGTTFCSVYHWTTGLGSIKAQWQLVANLTCNDNTDATAILRDCSLTRLSLEGCVWEITLTTNQGNVELLRMRLPRGAYYPIIDFVPESQANTTLSSLAASPPSNFKIVYNSANIADWSLTSVTLSPTTDYGYSAAIPSGSTLPYIFGWLYQNAPVYQPYSSSTIAPFAVGDSSGPGQSAIRSYGFFAVPYANIQNLLAEGESGTLGTGWSSVADGVASAGNTAKAASGTAAANADTFGTAWLPSTGTYDCWFRVKVTSAAGAVAEMTLGLWDSTSSVFVASTTFRANQASTSYVWLRAAAGVIPTAVHNMRFRAVTAGTLGTDWFIDEAALVPLTSTGNVGLLGLNFPQDLWQQFVFEKTTRLALA